MKSPKKTNWSTTIIIALLVIIIILLVCLLIFGKTILTNKEPKEPIDNVIDYEWHGNIPSDAIKGDFDGDGKSEYMWLTAYRDDSALEGICYIHFSNIKFPTISLEGCIEGVPVNEGDLNYDGGDEIGLMPDRFTSCWRSYYVRTFKDNAWNDLIEPIPTHCNQREECYDKTGKDCDWISTGFEKGEVKIYSSVFTDDGIFGKTDYVELK